MADGARRYARRAVHEVTTAHSPETFSAEDANTSGDGYGDAEALAQALTKLPQSQRQAIELMKLREMSVKEAAAATGASVGALKVSVHRGIALQKNLLWCLCLKGHCWMGLLKRGAKASVSFG
jgi:RNA polymerase sigma-70 factor (ECF subfamily)